MIPDDVVERARQAFDACDHKASRNEWWRAALQVSVEWERGRIADYLEGKGGKIPGEAGIADLENKDNLIEALVAALTAARSQVKTLGTPDDAMNNHILNVCDAALARARSKGGV